MYCRKIKGHNSPRNALDHQFPRLSNISTSISCLPLGAKAVKIVLNSLGMVQNLARDLIDWTSDVAKRHRLKGWCGHIQRGSKPEALKA